jgi:hypothetical protein
MYHDAIGKKGRALAADEKKQLTTGRNETPGGSLRGRCFAAVWKL